MKKDLTNAQVSILLEIDGQVHLVGFEKRTFRDNYITRENCSQCSSTNR